MISHTTETKVSGNAEVDSTVYVSGDDKELGNKKVSAAGEFSIKYSKQKPGTNLTVYAVDGAGNQSEATTVLVEDHAAPESPVATLATEKLVKGEGEPGSVIQVKADKSVLGSSKVNSKGEFEVTYQKRKAGTEIELIAIDPSGNKSQTTTAMIEKKINRISGDDRYETGAEISKSAFASGAETALLVRGDNFPDALAAAPYAYQLNAPILSTAKDKLSKTTKDELIRLGVENVIIIGGEKAVTETVKKEVESLNVTVERISGANRYETAAKIAEKIDSDQAIVSFGGNFADALAIAPYAARNGIPILLTATDKLPTKTKEALRNKTIIVGGTSVVSKTVANELPESIRLSGDTRYETNQSIIEHFNVKATKGFVTTGRNYADALTGSILAAKENAPILLVEPTKVPDAIGKVIQAYDYDRYSVLGGVNAVSDSVVEQLD